MKIPLNWLADYVPLTMPAGDLVDRLTIAGLEVAAARVFGLPVPDGLRVKPEELGPVWLRDKVVTAKVVRVEKHPNADKLKLVHLEYGAAGPKVVVTGAPNLAVGDSGMVVVLGLTGTLYRDGHVSPPRIQELKPTQLRGVPSDAMVMSEFELGLSDEHEGIILLPGDTPVGVPAADLFGDVVLDADVLPNMARCLSLLGVAREVAALTGQRVTPPDLTTPGAGEAIDGLVSVSIEDAKLSNRYTATLVRGVKIGPSPVSMQRRLAYAGMRPINNVVDVTNYVMLEWGQPLHAFDFDALVRRADGGKPAIVVRPAKPGEVLRTLDGVERKLSPEHLLIADAAGPIALAGVMGGAETEVTAATTNVLIESAHFDFVSIRRTSRAFDLPSEASHRFSRDVHPELAAPAAKRAAQLLHRHAGGTVAPGAVDCYPAPRPPRTIRLEPAAVERLLGVAVSADDTERILTGLEFALERDGPAWNVTVPPNRTDIQEGPADLIEELARVLGYDRLPARMLPTELPEARTDDSLAREEHVRDLLARAGLQEVITYSLTTPQREAALSPPQRDYVRLQNPISAERCVMRHTVLSGVLEILAANLRHADALRLFEIGPVYLPKTGEKLPDEPVRVAVALTGKRSPDYFGDPAPAMTDFADIKGLVEQLSAELHLPHVGYRPAKAAHLHPGISAEWLIAGESVGAFGQLHPKAAKAFELGPGPIFVGEFDLAAILAKVPPRFQYGPVPKFPAALRDVAVIVGEDVTAERIESEIRAAGGELLGAARLFDVYRGPSIPAGTKSLAYALSYQAADRTLTDKEVDKAHKKIEDRLKQVLKAAIRGQEV